VVSPSYTPPPLEDVPSPKAVAEVPVETPNKIAPQPEQFSLETKSPEPLASEPGIRAEEARGPKPTENQSQIISATERGTDVRSEAGIRAEAMSGAKAPERLQMDFFASAPIRQPIADDTEVGSSAKSYPEESPLPTKLERNVTAEVSESIAKDISKDRLPVPESFSTAPKPTEPSPTEEKELSGDETKDDKDAEIKSTKEEPKIKRRSFTGEKTNEDNEHNDPSKSPSKSLGFWNQEVGFFGTRKNQICVLAILAFVATSIIWTMFNVLFNFGPIAVGPISGGTQQSKELPSIYGVWRIKAEATDRGHHTVILSRAVIQPQDNEIIGMGKDDHFDVPFQLSQVETDQSRGTIKFRKDYVLDGKLYGKPIFYEGTMYTNAKGFWCKGTWTEKFLRGHFLQARPVTIIGEWIAYLDAPLSQPVTMNTVRAPSSGLSGLQLALPSAGGNGESFDLHKFFWTVFVGFIVLGIVIAVCGLVVFGPSGKLNIWAKSEYIPSQYKSQHNKMLNELGAGLKPGGLPLGRRKEWRFWKIFAKKDLAIPPELRQNEPHLLVLGGGDRGKSRLLASMITHDITSNDRSVIVIDSDGGLIDLVMRWITTRPDGKELAERVVLVDPTYRGGSLGYNPLEMPEDGDLQSAASSIVYGFKAIYQEPPGAQSKWDAQVASILRNSALLLMANGKTLTDLPTLLQDNDFRDILLEGLEKKKQEKVEYGTLMETWGQYKRLARTDQWITWCEPILNRVTPMLSDPRIRPILTKPVGDLKLKEVIKNKQILLVKVPQGQLDQNANLLGSLIVTGIKQATLALAATKNDKHPIALYLDEFDDFIDKETIESITSDTKKFQIGFIGCIKTLQHLPEDFRNQLTINIGTIACFSLAKKDGDMLGPTMFRVDGRKIKHQTIQNFFNKVNTSPQFELISDEEKLNIDRVVAQEVRTYFCYRVGTVAGVFNIRAPEFKDIHDKDVKWNLIERMHSPKTTDKKATA
jgi:hypothetical protein